MESYHYTLVNGNRVLHEVEAETLNHAIALFNNTIFDIEIKHVDIEFHKMAVVSTRDKHQLGVFWR